MQAIKALRRSLLFFEDLFLVSGQNPVQGSRADAQGADCCEYRIAPQTCREDKNKGSQIEPDGGEQK